MGKPGKDKTSVSVSLPDEWSREIERRGAALHLSRAVYLRLMVAHWWANGRPPLSEPDKVMQLARKR